MIPENYIVKKKYSQFVRENGLPFDIKSMSKYRDNMLTNVKSIYFFSVLHKSNLNVLEFERKIIDDVNYNDLYFLENGILIVFNDNIYNTKFSELTLNINGVNYGEGRHKSEILDVVHKVIINEEKIINVDMFLSIGV